MEWILFLVCWSIVMCTEVQALAGTAYKYTFTLPPPSPLSLKTHKNTTWSYHLELGRMQWRTPEAIWKLPPFPRDCRQKHPVIFFPLEAEHDCSNQLFATSLCYFPGHVCTAHLWCPWELFIYLLGMMRLCLHFVSYLYVTVGIRHRRIVDIVSSVDAWLTM